MAPLDGARTRFASANADGVVYVGNENLAVADAASLGRLLNGFDGLLQHFVREHDLDLNLGQEVDDVLRTPIELGVTLLAAKALRLEHSDALQTDLLQGFLHLVELEWLDDGLDLLHDPWVPPSFCRSARADCPDGQWVSITHANCRCRIINRESKVLRGCPAVLAVPTWLLVLMFHAYCTECVRMECGAAQFASGATLGEGNGLKCGASRDGA